MKVVDPRIGSVVLYKNNPVFLTSGSFLDPTYGRVSNYWTWKYINQDGTLGEEGEGYGAFRKYGREYSIETRIVWKSMGGVK